MEGLDSEIRIKYTFFLTYCNDVTMVTNKSKIYFFLDSYKLCLCGMHWFVSHPIHLSLTKPTMQQCFHPSVKHLLCRYITPSFVAHSFRAKGETRHFFPIHRCAFWFNLKYIFVSLCKYNSKLLTMGVERIFSRGGGSKRFSQNFFQGGPKAVKLRFYPSK